ncbi:hypothetical protein YC2023_098239 [Brassica napus]
MFEHDWGVIRKRCTTRSMPARKSEELIASWRPEEARNWSFMTTARKTCAGRPWRPRGRRRRSPVTTAKETRAGRPWRPRRRHVPVARGDRKGDACRSLVATAREVMLVVYGDSEDGVFRSPVVTSREATPVARGDHEDGVLGRLQRPLRSNQRESTRRRRLRVETIYEKVLLKVHTTIRFLDENPYDLRVPGRRSIQPTGSLTKVHPASRRITSSNLWVSTWCISKPSDFGRACPRSSRFHESKTQGHPSIDSGLPPGADCNVISRHQDEPAERPPCQKSRYNPGTRQEDTPTTSKPQGASSMLNAIKRPARRPE